MPEDTQIIAVDLDGTLAKDMEPFNPLLIGPPVPEMISKVRKAIAEGETVVVFTARLADKERSPKIQRLIAVWTRKHIGVELQSTNEKIPQMKAFWDDRARGVEKNEGEFKTASASISEAMKTATPHDQETNPDGPVSFFEPVENPHSVQPLRASTNESLTIYRTLRLQSINDLSSKGFGACWASDEYHAYPYWGMESGPTWQRTARTFIFKGLVSKEDVDWAATSNLAPDLHEIRLKDDVKVQIVAWKQQVGSTGDWKAPNSSFRTVTASKTAGYTVYVLTPESRALMLKSFPPKFPDVIAHHVTFRLGGKEAPPPAMVIVEGYSSDDSLEALVVSVDGQTTRPDGGIYHITLSLNISKGRKPVDSNSVIKINGWHPVQQPFEVQVMPQKVGSPTGNSGNYDPTNKSVFAAVPEIDVSDVSTALDKAIQKIRGPQEGISAFEWLRDCLKGVNVGLTWTNKAIGQLRAGGQRLVDFITQGQHDPYPRSRPAVSILYNNEFLEAIEKRKYQSLEELKELKEVILVLVTHERVHEHQHGEMVKRVEHPYETLHFYDKDAKMNYLARPAEVGAYAVHAVYELRKSGMSDQDILKHLRGYKNPEDCDALINNSVAFLKYINMNDYVQKKRNNPGDVDPEFLRRDVLREFVMKMVQYLTNTKKGFRKYKTAFQTGYRAGDSETSKLSGTALDVVNHQEEKVNGSFGLSDSTRVLLSQYPANAIVWVTRTKEDAVKYDPEELFGPIQEIRFTNPLIIAEDGEDGYLVLELEKPKTASFKNPLLVTATDPNRPGFLFPEMEPDLQGDWYPPNAQKPESEIDERPLEDRLDEAEGDKAGVERILHEFEAWKAHIYPGGALYRTDDAVIDVSNDGSVTFYDDPQEFVNSCRVEEFYPDAEDEFNKEFWSSPPELYHATDEDNLPAIMKEGLNTASKTRGMSNRGVGSALFTSENIEYLLEGSYGDAILNLDMEALKTAGGELPFVGREPDVQEGELRGALAHALDLQDYSYDYEQGMDPQTIIVYGGIPPQFLHIEQGDVDTSRTVSKTAAKKNWSKFWNSGYWKTASKEFKQWLGKTPVTRPSSARDLRVQEFKSAEAVESEPFMGGKFTIRKGVGSYRRGFSEDSPEIKTGYYTVYDGDKPVASMCQGHLVVDKKYRGLGVGTALAKEFMKDFPDYRPSSVTPKSKRIFEKALTAATTPEQMERWAKDWNNQFSPGEMGYAPAESLNWKEERNFDLHKIEGWDNGYYDHLNEEQKERVPEDEEWGSNVYYNEMCEAIKSHTIEEIFVVEGADGKFYVWEGNHRVGMAHVLNVDTMPAYVGYRKSSKSASGTRYYHDTDVSNRESVLKNGLLTSMSDSARQGGYGSIFFHTKLTGESRYTDVWEADLAGYDIEPDTTTDISGNPEYEGDSWWVVYQDVPSERLKLVRKGKMLTAALEPEYLGNCTEDEVVEQLFGDATMFAQALEDESNTWVDDNTCHHGDLLIKYDPETDIHSFYAKQGRAPNKTAAVPEIKVEDVAAAIDKAIAKIRAPKDDISPKPFDYLREYLRSAEVTLQWTNKQAVGPRLADYITTAGFNPFPRAGSKVLIDFATGFNNEINKRKHQSVGELKELKDRILTLVMHERVHDYQDTRMTENFKEKNKANQGQTCKVCRSKKNLEIMQSAEGREANAERMRQRWADASFREHTSKAVAKANSERATRRTQ